MKKVFTILMGAGMLTFLACGPSAEEKAKIEQDRNDSIARVDSIANAEKMAAERAVFVADSTAKAQAKAERDAFVADSTAKAAEKPAAKPAKKQMQEKKPEGKG